LSTRNRLACGFAWANLALTLAAIAIVGVSVLFRVQGGAEHKVVDVTQFAAFWGYLLLTPVLAASALLLRTGNRRCRVVSWALLGFWGCVLIAGTFVHL
jgi:hypothetical protein